jgi:fatty-acyl-CoA synthase
MTGGSAGGAPETVIAAFLASARHDPHRVAARVVERSRQEHALTYGELYRMAATTAAGLAARGLGPGERIMVALPASRDFLAAYLGALHAGVIPLVVHEPQAGRLDLYVDHLARMAEVMGAGLVLAPEEIAGELARRLAVPVATAAALRAGIRLSRPPPVHAEPDGIAHLQATSGSTGTPKLAVVRHANIVANIRAIGECVGHKPEDVLVTWLPLSHDMGLIGLSYALYQGIPVVLSDTANFVHNPLSWLQLLSRHAGTLSPAPNSAFQMCARLARLRPPAELDLSRWRVALCGAEPVHESTLRQFQEAFGRFGLSGTTLLPVYGLAEATLAATLPETGSPFSVDRVDAELLASGGRAEPRRDDDPHGIGVVCVGTAIPGHDLRVVDAQGRPLPDRAVGEIEIAGPSVIPGYWRDEAATAAGRRADGYLRTGDLGYLVEGRLHVAGRHKDLLIVNGRNYTPNQIETLVETVARSAATPAAVAVGLPDPQTRTETLHLLLDTRLAAEDGEWAVEQRVRDALAEVFGLGGITVHWVAAGRIPRTTSGKIQRWLCRRLAEEEMERRRAGTGADGAGRTKEREEDAREVTGP